MFFGGNCICWFVWLVGWLVVVAVVVVVVAAAFTNAIPELVRLGWGGGDGRGTSLCCC